MHMCSCWFSIGTLYGDFITLVIDSFVMSLIDYND